MSRFWADLSADRWKLDLDESAWWLRGTEGEGRVPVDHDLVGALAGISVPRRWRKGLLEVEIGDAHLRYLVIDLPTGISGGAERQAWVAERFRSVHGVDANDWRIALDDDAIGGAVLACAAPRTLVSAVERFASAHHFRIASFSGSFVLAYNRLPAQAVSGPGAFALLRGKRLTLGVWNRGQWRRVRGLAVGRDAGDTLSRALMDCLPGLTREWGADVSAVLHAEGVEPAFLPAGWRRARSAAGA